VFFEKVPPAGFTPAFDNGATASSGACTSCIMAAPTVSGTDSIFDIPGGTTSTWNAASSPYYQDWNGPVQGENITSGTAPTYTQTSAAFVDTAISFKTTSAFTADSKNSFYTLVAATNPAVGGTTCSDTVGCTITIPSSGAGHLFFLATADDNTRGLGSVTDSQSNTWTIPSGAHSCDVLATSTTNELSCAYLLSSTAATTKPCEITVYQKSKTVWVAIGEYGGERIETRGVSQRTAAARWREAARYKGN